MAALSHAPGLSSTQRDIAHRTVDHQLDQIQKARTYGVTIALGTDAGSQGVDHGIAVREELKLLMRAGLAIEAAVQCATGIAARLMGLKMRGCLSEGCRADYIVAPGPPEALPDSLEHSVMTTM